mgnify:CR=1 FL=1
MHPLFGMIEIEIGIGIEIDSARASSHPSFLQTCPFHPYCGASLLCGPMHRTLPRILSKPDEHAVCLVQVPYVP